MAGVAFVALCYVCIPFLKLMIFNFFKKPPYRVSDVVWWGSMMAGLMAAVVVDVNKNRNRKKYIFDGCNAA